MLLPASLKFPQAAVVRHVARTVASTYSYSGHYTLLYNNSFAQSPPMSRGYRGEAADGIPKLSPAEEALLKKAKPRSDFYWEKHVSMPPVERISEASFRGGPGIENSNSMKERELAVLRKRMIYRSKQRGWLEVDLLLGTWAQQHVHQLDEEELAEYESFLNMETIDIYNIITLRIDLPEHFRTESGTGLVERLQAWARESPLGQADPEKYKQVKSEHKLI